MIQQCFLKDIDKLVKSFNIKYLQIFLIEFQDQIFIDDLIELIKSFNIKLSNSFF